LEKANLMDEIKKMQVQQDEFRQDFLSFQHTMAVKHQKQVEDAEHRIQSYSTQIEKLKFEKVEKELEVLRLTTQLDNVKSRVKKAEDLVIKHEQEHKQALIQVRLEKEDVTGELAKVVSRLKELEQEAENALLEQEDLNVRLAEAEGRAKIAEERLEDARQAQEMSSFTLSVILNSSPVVKNKGMQTSFSGNLGQYKIKSNIRPLNDMFQVENEHEEEDSLSAILRKMKTEIRPNNVEGMNDPINLGNTMKSQLLHHEEKQNSLFKPFVESGFEKSYYQQEDSRGNEHWRYQNSKGEWVSKEKSRIDSPKSGSFEILQNPDSFEENKHK